jgi:hypothetical protein
VLIVSNQTPPKNIGPPNKPKGNIVHRMHCIVSLDIVLTGGCNAKVHEAWELSGDL